MIYWEWMNEKIMIKDFKIGVWICVWIYYNVCKVYNSFNYFWWFEMLFVYFNLLVGVFVFEWIKFIINSLEGGINV